jgi:hypothetical protein
MSYSELSMALREYKRRAGSNVFAVRLDLDTEGFTYSKWGETQRCKRGDWIVLNGADTYTVDGDVFARTYQLVSGAEYRKAGTVWAQQAASAGSISTKEGATQYAQGDYVVYNDREQTDGYAMSRAKFEEFYEPVGAA